MSVNHRGRDLNDIEKQGKSNWRIGNLFLLNLIKMKFELAAVEMVESSLLERVETLALLGFGVQWIITIVVLLSLFCLRKKFYMIFHKLIKVFSEYLDQLKLLWLLQCR